MSREFPCGILRLRSKVHPSDGGPAVDERIGATTEGKVAGEEAASPRAKKSEERPKQGGGKNGVGSCGLYAGWTRFGSMSH